MNPWGRYREIGLRVCVFSLLAAALLATIGSLHPPKKSFPAYLDDVRQGRAEAVSVPPTSGWHDPDDWTTVTWRTGLVSWHRATYRHYLSADPPGYATLPGGVVTMDGHRFVVSDGGNVRDQLINLTQDVSDEFGHGRGPVSSRQLQLVVAAPYIGVAAVAVWLLVFLAMLYRGPDPLATRWGWVWVHARPGRFPVLRVRHAAGA